MGLNRKPFQGVVNIVRFNWHFYFFAFLMLLGALWMGTFLSETINLICRAGVFLGLIVITNSLLASFLIYDQSDLYSLSWLENQEVVNPLKILNVSAGFDETSSRIRNIFPNSELILCDFYNSKLHTEVSIERARKLYPPEDGTIKVNSLNLPFSNDQFDLVIVFMAAHEIRSQEERIKFFQELNRVLNRKGRVFITEHLRDWRNFLAFTFGFFHFYSKKSWTYIFSSTGFRVFEELKTTPFISTFILKHYGDTN